MSGGELLSIWSEIEAGRRRAKIKKKNQQAKREAEQKYDGINIRRIWRTRIEKRFRERREITRGNTVEADCGDNLGRHGHISIQRLELLH